MIATTSDVELAGESRLFVGSAALQAEAPDLAAAKAVLEAVAGSNRGAALYRLAFGEFEAGTAKEPADQQQAAWLQRARDHFDAIVALAPEERPDEQLRGEAFYLGAECCRRLADPRGAIERVQRMLRDERQHERADAARLVLGECAIAVGDGNLAIEPLTQFLRPREEAPPDPSDVARANLWLGQARALRREFSAAEECFVRVTEISQGALAAEAQFRIGQARRDRDNLRGAADAFVKLPILYADKAWVRRGLLAAGECYQELRQADKAERFFRELIEQHAGSDEAKIATQQLEQR